jgi:helicase MOV-10
MIADNDIGVITPYHAQCLKIRSALRAVADGVKVGSVEEFQGQVWPNFPRPTVKTKSDTCETRRSGG